MLLEKKGKPKCKARLNTGGNRGMGSSTDGNCRLSGGRWAQVLKEARQHLISPFSRLHSDCLVPSTGVEGLLLVLWESLVAFPVLWKKNGPCLNSRKCLSSFCIDKKHQPHWLFTVRTNQLLTDPIVLCRLAGAGSGVGAGGVSLEPVCYISFLCTFIFSVSLRRVGSIIFLERLTKISWISHLECISMFHQEKDVQSLQKSLLLGKIGGII